MRPATLVVNWLRGKLAAAGKRHTPGPSIASRASRMLERLRSANLPPRQSTANENIFLRGYSPVYWVALVGLLITILAFRQVTSWETQRVATSFYDAANDRILVVQREIELTLGMIQDIASFFDASPRVGRREFRKFVDPVIKRYSGIEVLGWIRRVENATKSDFLEAARASFPPFEILEKDASGQITSASERSEYFPLLYVQPYKRNKDLLGLDMALDPLFFPLLQQSAQSGQLQVGERVAGQGGATESAFLVAVPVYFKNEMETTAELASGSIATMPQLRGLAIGIFRIGEIVELALRSLSAGGIDIRFYREIDDQENELLYTHKSRIAEPGFDKTVAENSEQLLLKRNLRVGGHYWRVRCSAIPGSFEADFWSGWFVLTGGFAFTALLTIYVATLVGRAEKVRLLVDQRTAQLSELVQQLNKEIIERRNAVAELQNLNDDLEYWVAIRTSEAERRAEDLEQFAYVASHDLKAPLRAIANLADWIGEDLEGKLEPASHEQLNLLKDRVRRMHALIEGLLEYSRVGRTEGSFTEVDCGKLLDEIIDSLSPPPSFRIEVQRDMPVFRSDRLQLGQVFSNLISNSIKHYRGNKGKIKVTMKELNDFYQFEVLDNGPGIAREYHDKIFKMFQALEASDYGSNTGIGLALVKKIVQEQGGTITLRSKVGKGARFRFTWPKKPG